MGKPKTINPREPLRRYAHGGDREAFVQSVMYGIHPRDAYLQAGFARCHAAGPNAYRILRTPAVAARLAYLREQAGQYEGQELDLRRRRVIALLEQIIAEDRSALFDEDWRLRPRSELTDAQRALLDGVRPTRGGPEAVMPSRLAAIQALARIEGLEAPQRSEVNIHLEQRYTDVELARWIAARLEDAAAKDVIALPAPESDRPPESENGAA